MICGFSTFVHIVFMPISLISAPTFSLLLWSNRKRIGAGVQDYCTHYKLYCNFYYMYYTYSLSALLLPLRWIISSTCPLHQCTLCASYSMRIVEWISVCGTYVRAWLGDASISRMQVSVNYSMAYCSINTIVIYIYMLLHYINTIVVQVVQVDA